MKFKKTKSFILTDQKNSEIKVVYGRFFKTIKIVGNDGNIYMVKRVLRLDKMPKHLREFFLRMYLKPIRKLHAKVLELDMKLGQK